MSGLTRTKLFLAAVGVMLFAVGARYDWASVRLAGIGLVLVAWLARFYRPRRDESPQP